MSVRATVGGEGDGVGEIGGRGTDSLDGWCPIGLWDPVGGARVG